MCCLYGMMDPNRSLSGREKSKLMHDLATAAEERGTDAAGYALNRNGRLTIYKRPIPGHKLHFRIRDETVAVTGHNRLTTQGNAAHNYNNHPFPGVCGGIRFALAHNGVLQNDAELRREKRLSKTMVETDSYIAVQLLEQKKSLEFASLRYMAEQIRGTFTFTVLTEDNILYIVKGDNPLHLYHFRRSGLYVYASTQTVAGYAVSRAKYLSEKPEEISLYCGDILKIDPSGKIRRERFNDSHLLAEDWFGYGWPCREQGALHRREPMSLWDQYLEDLRMFAVSEGFDPKMVDRLVNYGIPLSEIENYLYEAGAYGNDGLYQMEQ